MTMDLDRGAMLLPLARHAIASEWRITHTIAIEISSPDDAPWLHEPGACFVTLLQESQLRGCIGSLEAHRSLHDDVKANAWAAAFADPRFAPLQDDELDAIEIEISLLSATQPLHFHDEAEALTQLQPGIDGVVFEYRHLRSTFLPQVWEQLPDAMEFLSHLKRKCGLPGNFWADGVRMHRYTVSKFRERDLLP